MYAGRPDRRQVGEEIAARVWYQLITDDFRLLRLFAAERGCRLNAYLAGICRNQTLNFRKEERNRRAHERTAGNLDGWRRPEEQSDPNGHGFNGRNLSGLAKFVATLTPTERQFYTDVLLGDASANGDQQYSETNSRQLRSRVRRKLVRFLQG